MKICKNEATDLIRAKYKANPLSVPNAQVQPYQCLVAENKSYKLIGSFADLLTGELPLEIENADVADLAFKRTRAVDLSIGLKLLDGFLKTFGLPSAVVGQSLKNAKTISFGFEQASKNYLELAKLGKNLKRAGLKIDIEHPVLSMLDLKNKKLCLITDALVSSKLVVNVEKALSSNSEIDVPLLTDYIANGNLHLNLEHTSSTSIAFNGPTPLTYAFGCLEIGYHPVTGKVKFMDWTKLNEKDPHRSGGQESATSEAAAEGTQEVQERIADLSGGEAKILLDDEDELISLES